MKRNWDVVRRILLKAEALPTEDSELSSDQVENVVPAVAAYHMRLLISAGIIEGDCREALGPPQCFATGLTWEGHELLDRIRGETAWNKIKTLARDKGIDLTFESIKVLAKIVLEGLFKG